MIMQLPRSSSKSLPQGYVIGACVQYVLHNYKEVFAVYETFCQLSVSHCEPMSMPSPPGE